MKLSIVTTLYQSSRYLSEYYSRITEVANSINMDYEIVFVDDGSPDDSLAIARDFASGDPRVIVVELSKNYGHHKAMMAGLEHTDGNHCFLIDCDLEEPPECLLEFWQELAADEELDLIYGINDEGKEGGVLKSAASRLFYTIFNASSYVKIPDNELVARLMSRNYVEALLAYTERELFIPGIWADVGFKRKSVSVKKVFDGHSSYSLRKRFSMAIDAVTSFSTKPLVFIFYLGIFISGLSLLAVMYLLIQKIAYGAILSGWTSLIVSIYLIGGAILLALGILGIYLSRIFSEVKSRPKYIVRNVYSSAQKAQKSVGK